MENDDYSEIDEIEHSYTCYKCTGIWTTGIWLSDYEDDQYMHDNICPLCHMDIQEACSDLLTIKESRLEIVKYVLIRIYNTIIISLMIK